MKSAITIRLDDELDKMLNDQRLKRVFNSSEVIRDSLRRQLAILLFDSLREKAIPYAEKKGYLTDEDVFREIS